MFCENFDTSKITLFICNQIKTFKHLFRYHYSTGFIILKAHQLFFYIIPNQYLGSKRFQNEISKVAGFSIYISLFKRSILNFDFRVQIKSSIQYTSIHYELLFCSTYHQCVA